MGFPQLAACLPASGSWEIRSTVAVRGRPKAETFPIAPKLMLVSTPDLTWEGIRGCVVVPAPPQPLCLLQERRRAERAEQQRFRTEKERERQAKLAVGASSPPGSGFPFVIFSVTPRKSACVEREGNPNPS